MTMLTSRVHTAVARYDSRNDMPAELFGLAPIWDGVLHEFRNHLTVLLAAATEIRAASPSDSEAEIAGALTETEQNIQRLNALVGFVDAAVRDGAPMVADLDDVMDRALRLAAPAMGNTSFSLRKDRRMGVGNRGSALESLLAALLAELARHGAREIDIDAESSRGAIVLEIESDGQRPEAGSWRFVLASDLATRLGATVSTRPDGAGYVVRLA